LLIAAARRPGSVLKKDAIVALAAIHTESTMATLRETVEQDDRGELRSIAANGLGRVGPAAAPAILELARSTDVRVRHGALQAAGAMDTDQTADIARSLLNDQDEGIRKYAGIVIEGTSSALAAIARSQVKDGGSRVSAIEELWRRTRERSLDVLLPLLHDKDPTIRRAIVAAVAGIHLGAVRIEDDEQRDRIQQRTLPPLAEALGDPSEEVRRAAAALLTTFGDSGHGALVTASKSRNANARAAALAALSLPPKPELRAHARRSPSPPTTSPGPSTPPAAPPGAGEIPRSSLRGCGTRIRECVPTRFERSPTPSLRGTSTSWRT
jgi:HEAT repeat protein